MSVHLYQIHHSKATKEKLDISCIPFLNSEQDEFFENTPIRRIYEMPKVMAENDYIGVTAPKFRKKSRLTAQELIEKINKDVDAGQGKDAYIYCPVQGIKSKWDLSAPEPSLHGTIRDINIWQAHKNRTATGAFAIDKALNDSGVLPFKLFTERADGTLETKWKYCWNNFWIVKDDVFVDYCKNVLIPAMDWFKKQIFPKNYLHPGSQRLVTYTCFTLEGTFGAFLAHRNYTFDYLCKRKYRGKYEWLNIDGYEDRFINKKNGL